MADSTSPELQRLLATLNGYAASAHSDVVNPEHGGHFSGVNTHNHKGTTQPYGIPGLGFLPPQPAPATPESPTRPVQTSATSQSNKAADTQFLRSNTPSITPRLNSPAPIVPDASTITTWPAALKHVTKHLASDDKISSRIQHLISEQHKHEHQWWQGREALAALHKSRSGTSAQVSALLRSLGGKDTISAPNDPTANQAELDAYDAKVYKSLVNMTADFDRQLRAMGVPFFAIKHDLVILEPGKEKFNAVKGRLDKGELRELQRRMLQHLEDLFGD